MDVALGYIFIVSILLLIIGYGANKVILCLPAYLCLLGVCIYFFIISFSDIIRALVWGISIIILIIPFIFVIQEAIKIIKEKRKVNKKNRK